MIKYLYDKFLRRKYFNKIFILYITITTCTLFLLSYIVVNKVSQITIDKELKFNGIVIHNISEFVNSKYKLLKIILKQTYMDRYAAIEVFHFLQDDMDKFSSEYLNTKSVFDSYFYSSFSRDTGITAISIYKKVDEQIYMYTKSASFTFGKNEFTYMDRLNSIGNMSYPRVNIYPASKFKYSSDLVYTLSINIKEAGSNKNLGILMIDFNVNGFSEVLASLDKNMSGSMMVLTKDGNVVYDSSDKYYGKKYPHLDLLNNTGKIVKIDGQNCMINSDVSSSTDLIIASIIPVNEMLKKVKYIRSIIISTSLACILLCIIIMAVSSKFLSKRVNTIVSTIKKAHNGNFSTMISVGNTDDEIDEIASSFNRMSENLANYIERVYVSEVKQKSAELTALQAQINPHFLYNTLEAIRMKAVMAGNQDVGNMIFILAKLFRSSIKDQTIVKIEDEIKYCELYLNLFKIRYGNSFSYTIDVDSEIMEYAVIRHLLQPIIENYTVHGFNPKSYNNTISIKGYQIGNDIDLIIEDNGIGIEHELLMKIKHELEHSVTHKDSIGLINVNERIKLTLGHNYGLSIHSGAGKGTRVTVRIPAKNQEELINYVQSPNR